jgi:hypothetical protein
MDEADNADTGSKALENVTDIINSDLMSVGRTVLLENHINAHESEIKFVQLR